MQKPYPARRKYKWLLKKDPIPYAEARKIINTMRYSMPRDQNPQRWGALTQVFEALYVLNHKHDVELFPPKKLHALLCAAATDAQWFTDPTTFRKKREATPPGLLHCTGCEQILPEEMFEAGRLSHLCADCREQWQARKERATVAAQAKRCATRFEKLMGIRRYTQLKSVEGEPVPALPLALDGLLTESQLQLRRTHYREWLSRHLKKHITLTPTVREQLNADVYPYYNNILTNLYRDTRHAINRHTADDTRNEAKAEYSRVLFDAVKQARAELDRRLEEGTLDTLTEGQVHWTRLLDDDTLDNLTEAYVRYMVPFTGRDRASPLVTVRHLTDAYNELLAEISAKRRERDAERTRTLIKARRRLFN
jgi:hypothetical protein